MNRSTSSAEDLQTAFDRSFTAKAHVSTQETADLLAIAIYGNRYALRLDAIAGLHADKPITRIPVQKPALLGIAGFRGAILPIYDLGALIGLPPTGNPHWLAIVAKADLAIAFETFEGHLRVPTDAFIPNDSKDGGRQHLSHLLHSGDALRGVVNLSSALGPVMGEGRA